MVKRYQVVDRQQPEDGSAKSYRQEVVVSPKRLDAIFLKPVGQASLCPQ
jgi:hypothetical protein